MTKNEVINRFNKIVNNNLRPFLRSGDIESAHRSFVDDFIRQLYDLLNTALRNLGDPRYEVEIECDDEDNWGIRVREGVTPAQPGSHLVYFSVYGDVDQDIQISLSKRNVYYDYSRIRSEQGEFIIFSAPNADDDYSRLSLEVTRRGRDQRESVFNYFYGKPCHGNCTYRSYL